jgi:phosphoribosylanthranilate isomerase
MTQLWVKICGVTTVSDALMVAHAGASAIGLNFVPGSPRLISVAQAREIVAAVGPVLEWVGVFVDQPWAQMLDIRREVGLDWIQLHGDETPAAVLDLAPAFKALRIGSVDDVALAGQFGGEHLLADAKAEGAHGGTGKTFDWSLVAGLCRSRRVVLAGGLTPDNVAEAVRQVDPFGVDTASGVESAPGKKDPARTSQFVQRARAAHAALRPRG